MNSNVTSILDKLEQRDAFFPVETRRVQTTDGKLIADKVATIRADTGEPLGIVSPTYKVVTNEQAFTSFAQALDNLGIDLEGATPLVEYSHGGAKTLVQLVLPSLTWEEPNGNGKTAFRMIMKNSYDGSWKLEAFGGGLRGACMNGQVFGNWMARYASRHVRSLSIKAASEKIAMAFDMWEKNKLMWDQMQNAHISNVDAFVICAAYAKQPKLLELGYDKAVKEEKWGRTLDSVFNQWTLERKALGSNVWALYNALTHHATHNDMGFTDVRASGRVRREEDVANIIESDRFQRLLVEKAA